MNETFRNTRPIFGMPFLTKGLQCALFEILRPRLNKCIKFTDVNDAVFDEN